MHRVIRAPGREKGVVRSPRNVVVMTSLSHNARYWIHHWVDRIARRAAKFAKSYGEPEGGAVASVAIDATHDAADLWVHTFAPTLHKRKIEVLSVPVHDAEVVVDDSVRQLSSALHSNASEEEQDESAEHYARARALIHHVNATLEPCAWLYMGSSSHDFVAKLCPTMRSGTRSLASCHRRPTAGVHSPHSACHVCRHVTPVGRFGGAGPRNGPYPRRVPKQRPLPVPSHHGGCYQLAADASAP